MPKRKRSAQASLLKATLEKHQDETYRALKVAKGFERHRLSKRLRQEQEGVQTDRRQKIQLEITVLKSLDLRQTARTHLISSLLKVGSIASSPNFPKELQINVPEPDIPQNERNALHNVTSALYNKELVKQARERAIAAVSVALDVPVSDRTKRFRKNTRPKEEEQHFDRTPNLATPGAQSASDDESDFEGFATVVDKPDSKAEATEEADVSKYEHLLGSCSDDDDEIERAKVARSKGSEAINLEDIAMSSSLSKDETGENSDSSSGPASPPILGPRKVGSKQSVTSKGVIGGYTFLPSLMGGYISGSESASDIEEARPKKRRGQRARQAIWEKKYGAAAKHLQRQRQAGGRDAGWDMKRGAVEQDSRDRTSPWRKTSSGRIARNGNNVGDPTKGNALDKPTLRPTKRDDQGPLHPSWAAKKKAQDAQKNVSFSGQKILFD